MKLHITHFLFILGLAIASYAVYSTQVNVQVHVNIYPEDDAFRTESIRYFESKYVKNGFLTGIDDNALRSNNLLLRYYDLIGKSSIVTDLLIAGLTELAGEGLYAAMINLGDIYSVKNSKYLNSELAVKWYTKAEILKNSTHALVRLGFAYETLIHDHKKAIEIYSKACEIKDAIGCFNLGALIYRVEHDLSAASAAFEEAHRLGHDKAGKDLYVIYKDLGKKEALSYLKDSADRGYNEAQYFYGSELIKNENLKTGLDYLVMSAQNGFVPAQSFLGMHYSKTINSKKDFEIAERWYLKAAIAGDEPSRKNLMSLYNIYEELIPELKERKNYLVKIIEADNKSRK